MMNKLMKKITVALTVATMAIAGTAAIASANETKYVANEIGLNVREKASAESERLGGLLKGDTVDVVSISNGWAKINYNGKTAYVLAEYLSNQKPAKDLTGYPERVDVVNPGYKATTTLYVTKDGQYADEWGYVFDAYDNFTRFECAEDGRVLYEAGTMTIQQGPSSVEVVTPGCKGSMFLNRVSGSTYVDEVGLVYEAMNDYRSFYCSADGTVVYDINQMYL